MDPISTILFGSGQVAVTEIAFSAENAALTNLYKRRIALDNCVTITGNK